MLSNQEDINKAAKLKSIASNKRGTINSDDDRPRFVNIQNQMTPFDDNSGIARKKKRNFKAFKRTYG